jgi:hypothetical protein
MDGTWRSCAPPSSSPSAGRTCGSPAQCRQSRSVGNGSSRASRRTRCGRAGSARSRSSSRGRPTAENASPTEDLLQRPHERLVIRLDEPRFGHDQNVPSGLERRRHRPKTFAESPSHPVPDDGTAELAPGRQSEARDLEVGPQESSGQQRLSSECSGALQPREILRMREHHEPRPDSTATVDQAVSRLRPRARRAARTRRPPVVFIRARKPCSLARCRFLGW